MRSKVALFCALTAIFAQAHAEDHAVTGRVGMLGLGLEYAYTINPRLAVRGGIYGSGFSFDESESGIDYAFEFDWESISIGVDFYPTQGPLRITAGALQNDNALRALSTPSQDITVGGTTYTPAEVGTLRAAIGFDSFAPFVGVGWDWSRSRRIGVSLDLGLVSQGSPNVSLSADGSLLGDPIFQSDIDAEAAELQDALGDLDLFPFATFGVVFRF